MKTKVAKMAEMLERAERVLARCQNIFPDSQKYDSIANGVSNMRGDIQDLLADKTEDKPVVLNINSLIGELHIYNTDTPDNLKLEAQILKIFQNVLNSDNEDNGASKSQRKFK